MLTFRSHSLDLVFFGQFVQTLAMSIHYAFIGDDFNIIFLLQEYLLSVQYSMVFYYFIQQLSENMINIRRLKVPLIILNIGMLSGFFLYVIINLLNNEGLYNCNNGIWVYLHGCGMVLSVIFIVLGTIANRYLDHIGGVNSLLVDWRRLKHFWYALFRIIISSMTIASIVNVAESLFFIGIDNDSCYNSYSQNEDLDIAIFIFIRIFSHYLFVISCLLIFRIERQQKIQFDINTESDSSFRDSDAREERSSENSFKKLNNFAGVSLKIANR